MTCFTVPAGHPSLPGHFPGNPLVPGVLLLDHALACVLPAGARATGLQGVKFAAPVRPDDEVVMSCTTPRPGRLAFEGRVGGMLAFTGTALLAEAAEAAP